MVLEENKDLTVTVNNSLLDFFLHLLLGVVVRSNHCYNNFFRDLRQL